MDKRKHIKAKRWFPAIKVSSDGTQSDFINLVNKIAVSFDYSIFPYWLKEGFKYQKKHGFQPAMTFLNKLRKEARKNRNLDTVNANVNQALCLPDDIFPMVYAGQIGQEIFNKIPLDKRKKFFPFNDFQLFPYGDFGQDFFIKFSSLEKIQSEKERGYFYCSPNRPKVKINGKDKILVFSNEAIRQMGANLPFGKISKKRFMPIWEDYYGLGDFHGFLYGCINFEQVADLYDPQSGAYVPAVTCFETCNSEYWFSWSYVTEVVEKYDPTKNYYYRVGYFPLAIWGDYAIAKTILLPGFKQTPEYDMFQKSDLTSCKKKEISKVITEDGRVERLMETYDFSLIKCLHSFVPQVIQAEKEMFKPVFTKATP